MSIQHAYNYGLRPGDGLGHALGGGQPHPLQQWNVRQQQSKYRLTTHQPFLLFIITNQLIFTSITYNNRILFNNVSIVPALHVSCQCLG